MAILTAAKGKRPNMPYAYTRYFTPNAMLKSRQEKAATCRQRHDGGLTKLALRRYFVRL